MPFLIKILIMTTHVPQLRTEMDGEKYKIAWKQI